MTLRDPQEHMHMIVERFRTYDHPKARVYVEYYDEAGYFPEGIWEDVQLLHMKFNMQIAMGLPPEDIEED
jgi:hypothetical protein